MLIRLIQWNGTATYSGSGANANIFDKFEDEEEGRRSVRLLQSAQATVVEWFLLGEMDDVILSETSTFGQTAWTRYASCSFVASTCTSIAFITSFD